MKEIKLLAIVVTVAFLAGCASLAPIGTLYTSVKIPSKLGDVKDVTYSKIGQASVHTYFALVAIGDASVDAAAKNGGIKNIKYVDYDAENIAGVFGTYTTTVYGD